MGNGEPDLRSRNLGFFSGDRQGDGLIGDVFDEEKDPIQLIKWKEIYETMERASDKCEDAANILESVVLKNA